MTSEATLGKNGANLPVEINFSKDERARTQDENKGEGKSLYILHLERLEYSEDVQVDHAKRQRKTRGEKKGSVARGRLSCFPRRHGQD